MQEKPKRAETEQMKALRETLAKLEAGEIRSDLFDSVQSEDEPGSGPVEGRPAPKPSAPKPSAPIPSAPAPSATGFSDKQSLVPPGSASAGSTSDQYAKARAVVLRKITGSPKSRQQLADALKEREFDAVVIRSVLDRMEQVHLVDDQQFARTWVRTRYETKGLGAAALRRELREKGIDGDLAEEALEQISAEDETTAARKLIDNKLRGVAVPSTDGAEDRKERDKLTRRLVGMLARRGHSPGSAFSLVREELDSRSR